MRQLIKNTSMTATKTSLWAEIGLTTLKFTAMSILTMMPIHCSQQYHHQQKSQQCQLLHCQLLQQCQLLHQPLSLHCLIRLRLAWLGGGLTRIGVGLGVRLTRLGVGPTCIGVGLDIRHARLGVGLTWIGVGLGVRLAKRLSD